MPENTNNTDSMQWWIAHGKSRVLFGEAAIGVRTTTGQPYLEIFNDEQEWAERVRELGSEPYPDNDDPLEVEDDE